MTRKRLSACRQPHRRRAVDRDRTRSAELRRAFGLAAAIGSLVLPAGVAQAGCATSSDGLTRTCTGDVGNVQSFDQPDQTEQKTFSFLFDQLTSTSMSGSADSGTPTISFIVEGQSSTSTSSIDTIPGVVGPGQVFKFNLDTKVPDFALNSSSDPVVEITTKGGHGNSPGEKEHSGKQVGNDGGGGASGGDQTISISDAAITASPGKPFTVASTGGYGGTGAEGFATSDGDGVGGNGGKGGDAGTVTVNLTAVGITNDGGDATILDITNRGGAGGGGGAGKSKDYTGQGGAGGQGANGGSITLNLAGGLDVTGLGATGITLSSLGGAAGNGGLGDDLLDGKGNGGVGGKGGTGGDVTLQSSDDGAINVKASGLGGIIVQSFAGQGGGGGDGKTGSSGDGKADGGTGGQGGTGGSATVDLTANSLDISTTGSGAQGILVRSYGGAGGDGGEGKGGRAKGGSGAGSGPGGSISTTVNGSISTTGEESNGILAHSVGGFSGDAGKSAGTFVAYGAGSESAGAGGQASVAWTGDSSSLLQTQSDDSDGIFAQSQGGGGGKGSKSSSAIDSIAGSGSAGGAGGIVTVTAAGARIATKGARSRAIVAMSSGGGGGDGGGARGIMSVGGSGAGGGVGGAVTVSNSAVLSTAGPDAQGIFAESVGGGGGAAASTSGITAVGGGGGTGATGGTVSVTNSADITTQGMHSEGIFALSQGGGGGRGSSALAIGVGFSYAVGGKGGTGGHGGSVTIHGNNANGEQVTVMTSGDVASGVVAESVGGGGGHGGSAISVSGAEAPFDISIAVGGSGSAAGDGGTVSLNFDGQISTQGDHAMGLMATSTGGGGGSGGTTISVANSPVGTLSTAVGAGGGGGGAGGAGDRLPRPARRELGRLHRRDSASGAVHHDRGRCRARNPRR